MDESTRESLHRTTPTEGRRPTASTSSAGPSTADNPPHRREVANDKRTEKAKKSKLFHDCRKKEIQDLEEGTPRLQSMKQLIEHLRASLNRVQQ